MEQSEGSPKEFNRSNNPHERDLATIVHPDHIAESRNIFSRFQTGEIDIIEAQTQSEQLLIKVASVDFMTGLDNARAANIKLEGLMNYCHANGLPLTVVYLDGDGIKQINTESHDLGDIAIMAIAEAIKLETRLTDESSRLNPEKPYENKDSQDSPVEARRGGDEFEIILPGANLEGAEKVFYRIKDRLSSISNTALPGRMLSLTGGAVLFDRNTDKSAEELSSRAERAMEFGKQNGKGEFYASAEPLIIK